MLLNVVNKRAGEPQKLIVLLTIIIGVKDERIFKEGLETAVEKIRMENLCWLGNIPDYVKEFYDLKRIIKIQTRTELLQMLKRQKANENQLLLAV